MNPTDGQGESITPDGLERLKAEIAELEGPRRVAIAERIKAARELGDLKENAEYHIAKDDQAHLETRIKRLRAKLASATVIEDSGDGASFGFGRSALVIDLDSGAEHTWTLVGSTEADPSSGKISAESPVGKALRDTPVGAEVEVATPGGQKRYRIEQLLD